MKYIEYLFFRCLHVLVSIIPFRLLYVMSDVCAVIMQYLIRYRTNTVSDNLKNAFPKKSPDEIKIITRQFYKHLCDITLESIKGYSLSTKQILKRYQFLNPDIANQYYEKGQDIIIALSHYCNWEWGARVAGSIYRHKLVSLYKPMSNRYIDKYIRKQRMKRSMELVSIYDPKYFFRSKKNKPKAYFFISDQSPGRAKKAIWVRFLNQDTACLRGIEDYAKLFNLPVIYMDIQRDRRGHYTLEMQELCVNPAKTLPGEITENYMRKLEAVIIEKPEDWLWSHRRWKLKKQ